VIEKRGTCRGLGELETAIETFFYSLGVYFHGSFFRSQTSTMISTVYTVRNKKNVNTKCVKNVLKKPIILIRTY